MCENPILVFVGDYERVGDAKADLEVLRELHSEHVVGTYDAAIITKTEEGKVKERHA